MLSLLIQQAIEARIAPLNDESLNLNGDPYGSDSRLRVQSQFWVAYQSSDYPTGTSYLPDANDTYSQNRELEFQHYVEVEDLRRDCVQALALHERLMAAIAGFRPLVDGVRSPLRLTNDAVVSAKVENEVVYRYRATYRVLCKWVPQPLIPVPVFVPRVFQYGIWRSPVAQVAAPAPISVKDAEAIVEGVEIGP
jgi:hypothetical protein